MQTTESLKGTSKVVCYFCHMTRLNNKISKTKKKLEVVVIVNALDDM